MDNYTPKLHHAILLALLGNALIFGSMYLDGRALTATVGTGLLLLCFSVVVMFFLGNREKIARIDSEGRFADAIAKLDHTQWQAFGIKYPTVRLKWDGEPMTKIEDTEIGLDEFRRFMKDSNPRQISPERNWSTGADRRTWARIQKWLKDNDWIYDASAAGSHSWLWRGNSFQTIKDRYVVADAIPEMTKEYMETETQ